MDKFTSGFLQNISFLHGNRAKIIGIESRIINKREQGGDEGESICDDTIAERRNGDYGRI